MHTYSIEWREIPQYSRYQASNNGLIRCKYGSTKRKSGHILALRSPKRHDYFMVKVINDSGKRKTVFLHALIIRAFHGDKPFPEAVTRHIDGNPLNNSPENLVWGTTMENVADSIAHGTFVKIPKGGKFNNFRQEWKRLSEEGFNKKEIAAMYGCHRTLIQKYIDGII